jgi:hydroxymethylglutaryl-CoA lyase
LQKPKPTEEEAHALEFMGFQATIDLLRLIAAARRLPTLLGHEMLSQIVKAGCRLDLHPVPADSKAIRQRALARQG